MDSQIAANFLSPQMTPSWTASDTSPCGPVEIPLGNTCRAHFNLTTLCQFALQKGCSWQHSQQQCINPPQTTGILQLSHLESMTSQSFSYFHNSAAFYYCFCFRFPPSPAWLLPVLSFFWISCMLLRVAPYSWLLWISEAMVSLGLLVFLFYLQTLWRSFSHYSIWHTSMMSVFLLGHSSCDCYWLRHLSLVQSDVSSMLVATWYKPCWPLGKGISVADSFYRRRWWISWAFRVSWTAQVYTHLIFY